MSDPRAYMRVVRPCKNCPFVADNEFPLSSARREEIADALTHGDTFFCHETIDYRDGETDTGSASRCFGAASMLHRAGYPPMQTEQIIHRLGIADYNPEQYERDDVYQTIESFLEGTSYDR